MVVLPRFLLLAMTSVSTAVLASSSFSSAFSDWDDASSSGSLLQYSLSASFPAPLYASVGNGYFATTLFSHDLYVANTYNGPADAETTVSHAAKIPSPFNTKLEFGTGRGAKEAEEVREALDLRGAKFLKRYVFDDESVVQETWAAHRELYHSLIYRVELLEAKEGETVEVCFNADSAIVWNSDDLEMQVLRDGSGGERPSRPGTTFMNATTLEAELDELPLNTIAVIVDDLPSCTTLSSEKPFQEFVFSIDKTAEGVLSHYDEMKSLDSTERWNRHSDAWTDIWSSSVDFLSPAGALLPSDALYLAQVTNSSLYYLYSSLSKTLPNSIAPGTLSSNDYNQHVFWDAPTWMLPTLSLFHPDIATMMLTYYIDRMDGARSKAEDNGYEGLMFPWESAQSGRETCPTWAPTGVYEQHISSDIVIAAAGVYFQTRDPHFLAEVACPLSLGVSDFWLSRVTFRDGSYHIDNVIPPDEYAQGVNDSAYTNAAASRALSFAREFCCVGEEGGSNCDMYETVAAGLHVPYDEEKDFHPEYEGYTNQTAKQADVTLLKYPLEWKMNDTTFKNDLAFYSTHTDEGGPAMTWGSFAIGHLSLGEDADAAPLFRKSFETYAKSPFLIWTETPTGGAKNFATGMGGFLQVLSAGFAGIRVRSDGLHANLRLPIDFEGLCGMRLRGIKIFGGNLVNIESSECGGDGAFIATVEVTKAGEVGVCVKDQEFGSAILDVGARTTVGREFVLIECGRAMVGRSSLRDTKGA